MSAIATAFVFARGGSKGLPRKNLQDVGGVPLVGRSVEAGLAAQHVRRVVVSTDDAEIAAAAVAHGAEVPTLRPAELAADDTPEWAVWQHAVAEELARGDDHHFDVFVSLPPTAPLRLPEDVDRCVEAFLAGGADIVVTVRPAERNPWFNMVVLDEHGHARLAAGTDGGRVVRRQEAPEVWDLTTVAYVTTPDFIRSASGIFDGRVKAVAVPRERAVDIDDAYDLAVARCLHAHGLDGEG